MLAALIPSVVSGVGGILDELFTSDEEREKAKLALLQIEQLPVLKQLEINQVEAAHPSIFVAGWRPAIGWICALALGLQALAPFIGYVCSLFGVQAPPADVMNSETLAILAGLLGLPAIGARTLEKVKGVDTRKTKR